MDIPKYVAVNNVGSIGLVCKILHQNQLKKALLIIRHELYEDFTDGELNDFVKDQFLRYFSIDDADIQDIEITSIEDLRVD